MCFVRRARAANDGLLEAPRMDLLSAGLLGVELGLMRRAAVR